MAATMRTFVTISEKRGIVSGEHMVAAVMEVGKHWISSDVRIHRTAACSVHFENLQSLRCESPDKWRKAE